MSPQNRQLLLEQKCEELGNSQVARDTGCSATTISLVRRNKYGADTDRILERVAEVYGSDHVNCPLLGDISLGRCATERRRDFSPTNRDRVQQYRTCRTCPNNPDNGGRS